MRIATSSPPLKFLGHYNDFSDFGVLNLTLKLFRSGRESKLIWRGKKRETRLKPKWMARRLRSKEGFFDYIADRWSLR